MRMRSSWLKPSTISHRDPLSAVAALGTRIRQSAVAAQGSAVADVTAVAVCVCVVVLSMPGIAKEFDFGLQIVESLQHRARRCSWVMKHWQILVLKWVMRRFWEDGVASVVVAVTPGMRLRMRARPWTDMREPEWQRWVDLTSRLLVSMPWSVETPKWAQFGVEYTGRSRGWGEGSGSSQNWDQRPFNIPAVAEMTARSMPAVAVVPSIPVVSRGLLTVSIPVVSQRSGTWPRRLCNRSTTPAECEFGAIVVAIARRHALAMEPILAAEYKRKLSDELLMRRAFNRMRDALFSSHKRWTQLVTRLLPFLHW